MGDADHTVGHPYDNASVARRLGGETFSTQLDGLIYDGFRVEGRTVGAGEPDDDQAVRGQPGDGELHDGQAVRGQGDDGQPGDGQPGDGQSGGGQSGDVQPGGKRVRSADSDSASATGMPVAVLVHGWPQFAACWEETARALVDAGIDVIAYDQRGYSPGAVPDAVEDYDLSRLIADLHGLVQLWGLDRFHLVGHDWGGIVGWSYAALHPEKVATFTSVSTAHPIAHGERIKEDPEQYERMHYLRRIRQDPAGVEQRLLADNGVRLAAMYDDAIASDRVQSYIERFSQPGTMDAALKYYRALGNSPGPATTPITVPTLYVWGSEDLAFTRGAAELTGDYVDGDYRFVEIPGATHWLPEQEPRVVAGAVIDWIHDYA